MIEKPLALLCTILAFVGLLERHASAQTWQAHQLTHFTGTRGLVQCSAVADTLGNIHHYFIARMGNGVETPHVPMLYMRTDIYGHVLTDTVRVSFSGPFNLNIEPDYCCVVGDGANSWCLFADSAAGHDWWDGLGLYLTGRDVHGDQLLPATMLGWPMVVEGPASWDMSASLRTADSTVHAVGAPSPFFYYRCTTAGQTLTWQQHLDGVVDGVGPFVQTGPDGTVWAAMRDGWSPTTEVVLIRFGPDSSETVYHPFPSGNIVHWGIGGFALDSHYNFHFLLGCDTVQAGYYRLDTNMVVQESYTIDPGPVGFGAIRADTAGNCVTVWGKEPGLKWAVRRHDGVWTRPPEYIDRDMEGSSFTIVSMDTGRIAFTVAGCPRTQDVLQLYLYTYGFPPDTTQSSAGSRIAPLRSVTLSAFPNPFTSSLHVELPVANAPAIAVFDILGRTAWSSPLPQGSRSIILNDPRLAHLPSGTYFLALRGNSHCVPFQITHFK